MDKKESVANVKLFLAAPDLMEELYCQPKETVWSQVVFWDEGTSVRGEPFYDAEWRPAPEALPEHEEDEDEGERD